MEISQETIIKAIEIAKNARQNAFIIRSNHPIGACVITNEEKLYGGCNTENDISGLGVCAERSAVDHAVVNGQYQYKGIVIVDDEFTSPCGTCLQYLELFSQIDDKNIAIIIADNRENYEIHSLKELLPDGYKTKNGLDVIKSFKNKDIIKVKED